MFLRNVKQANQKKTHLLKLKELQQILISYLSFEQCPINVQCTYLLFCYISKSKKLKI